MPNLKIAFLLLTIFASSEELKAPKTVTLPDGTTITLPDPSDDEPAATAGAASSRVFSAGPIGRLAGALAGTRGTLDEAHAAVVQARGELAQVQGSVSTASQPQTSSATVPEVPMQRRLLPPLAAGVSTAAGATTSVVRQPAPAAAAAQTAQANTPSSDERLSRAVTAATQGGRPGLTQDLNASLLSQGLPTVRPPRPTTQASSRSAGAQMTSSTAAGYPGARGAAAMPPATQAASAAPRATVATGAQPAVVPPVRVSSAVSLSTEPETTRSSTLTGFSTDRSSVQPATARSVGGLPPAVEAAAFAAGFVPADGKTQKQLDQEAQTRALRAVINGETDTRAGVDGAEAFARTGREESFTRGLAVLEEEGARKALKRAERDEVWGFANQPARVLPPVQSGAAVAAPAGGASGTVVPRAAAAGGAVASSALPAAMVAFRPAVRPSLPAVAPVVQPRPATRGPAGGGLGQPPVTVPVLPTRPQSRVSFSPGDPLPPEATAPMPRLSRSEPGGRPVFKGSETVPPLLSRRRVPDLSASMRVSTLTPGPAAAAAGLTRWATPAPAPAFGVGGRAATEVVRAVGGGDTTGSSPRPAPKKPGKK